MCNKIEQGHYTTYYLLLTTYYLLLTTYYLLLTTYYFGSGDGVQASQRDHVRPGEAQQSARQRGRLCWLLRVPLLDQRAPARVRRAGRGGARDLRPHGGVRGARA